MTENTTKKRVKVYKLNDEGEWDDAGTGHVSCVHLEKFDALSLLVKAEEDPNKILLESKIQQDDIYQRQQETLIVWQEPESGFDLALSFQEEPGCQQVWEQICAVQGRNPLEEETGTDEDEENFFGGISLPSANVNNLEKINEILKSDETVSTEHKEIVAGVIVKDNYLPKLIDLFKICEEAGNMKHLFLLFNIFKNMVMLNEPALLELMFSDENFSQVVGALEYDPEVSFVKNRHRSFLQNTAVFKEVVPIRNKAIVQRIHHTFRVQYLKDVVLPRLLDDMTFATINSIIFFNNVEIAESLYTDKRFMGELFEKLKAPPNEESMYDLLCFLQELCNLAKNLQIPQQKDFYRTLANQGIFNVFEANLSHADIRLRLCCADLVNNVLIHEPNSFRQYLLSQDPHYKLFRELISRALTEPDPGLMSQYIEVVRILLDTENFEEASLRDQFLTFFYRQLLKDLITPLNFEDDKETQGDNALPQKSPNRPLQHEICELLAFFLQHHGYHIKYYLLNNNVISKIAKLMEAPDKHLVLASLRFIRALIGTKDDMLIKHVIKSQLFGPVMAVFKQNVQKYNLLNSAVIELIDFIRKENIKPLVRHVVDNFSEIFKHITYVETFKLLVSKYQQNKDYEENYLNKTFSPQGTSPQKKADSDDESYFFGTEEEAPDLPKGLVPYELDDEKEAAERVSELEEKMKKKRQEDEKENDALLRRWEQLKKQNGDSTGNLVTSKKRKVGDLEINSGGNSTTPSEAVESAEANPPQRQQEGDVGVEGGEPTAPKKLKFTLQATKGKPGNL